MRCSCVGLRQDNRSLREDLGFFERLTPAGKGDRLAIRGLHAEVLEGSAHLRWQMLAMQPARNAPEFKGRVELLLGGTLDGEFWTSKDPIVSQPLQFQQYRRVQGTVSVLQGAMVKTVTARLVEGTALRAARTFFIGMTLGAGCGPSGPFRNTACSRAGAPLPSRA